MTLPKSRWARALASLAVIAAVAGITLGVTTLLGVTFQGSGEAQQRTVTVDGFRIPTLTSDDVKSSQLVARVRIAEAEPALWDTPDGEPPPPRSGLPTSDDPLYVIYTPLRGEVLDVFKGDVESREIVLRHEGGEIGDVRMVISPSPNLKVGDEAVVFLYRAPESGGNLWMITESYTVTGEEAFSSLDQRSLAADDLIGEVQQAVVLEETGP